MRAIQVELNNTIAKVWELEDQLELSSNQEERVRLLNEIKELDARIAEINRELKVNSKATFEE